MQRLTGTSVPRREDPRLLTGHGRYVDDLSVPGMLHAAFVRSTVAHGHITRIDATTARQLDGVHLVLTDDDLRPHVGDLTPTGAEELFTPAYSALARTTVRLVGEPIAIVIATSRAIAEDAAALVEVDITPLDAVIGIDAALADGGALLFPEHGSNVVFRSSHRYGDTGSAFAGAAHVIRERFVQHRHTNSPMECRAVLADWDPSTLQLEYHVAHQAPHALRLGLANLLGHPAHRLRVRCGDIGGSFGQKSGISREDVAVCAAARLAGRPVKWIEDRQENLVVAGHARDERVDVEVAVDAEGGLLGVRATMAIDVGAYPALGFPASGFLNVVRCLLPAAYRLEHYDFDGIAVASNTATYVPYRGPWEVETWVRERVLDVVARTVGSDPLTVRRRNLLRSDELPRTSVTGTELMNISQRESLERAVELVDHEAFRERQRSERERGRYLGIGIANFIEPAPFMPSLIRAMGFMAAPRTVQEARVRLEPDGTFTLFTSQQPHGQSHETTLAQLAADELSVGIETIRVIHGDTDVTPFNLVGTGGSRAATLASGAVLGSARAVRDRILEMVSKLWEVDVADLRLEDGAVTAVGVPSRAASLAELGLVAHTRPGLANESGAPGVEESYSYLSGEGTWSQSTHCCVVEVDVATGAVHIERYLVVEDCGQIINPAVVDGQVRGGVAQGIGSVLLERSAFDEHGQPLAGTFMDYLLPTAMDVPHIEVHHLHSEPDDDVPFRGVGEGGAIGAPAALTNAIEDALAPFGVEIREQYLPPHRILELCGVIPGVRPPRRRAPR